MQQTYNRWLLKHGGWLLGAGFGMWYLIGLFASELQNFVTAMATLMVTVSIFAGLCFAFSSVIETSSDKATCTMAGEKLFFATICIAFSGLAGFLAIQVEGVIWLWGRTVAALGLKCLSSLYLGSAVGAISHAHEWTTDLLLTRWNRRLVVTDRQEESR